MYVFLTQYQFGTDCTTHKKAEHKTSPPASTSALFFSLSGKKGKREEERTCADSVNSTSDCKANTAVYTHTMANTAVYTHNVTCSQISPKLVVFT